MKINFKKNHKKLLIISGATIPIIIAAVIIVFVAANSNKLTLHILNRDYSLPITVRTLENIGFTTEDANSNYKLKEEETKLEFKEITYYYKNKYNSSVDQKTIPQNDGMTVIVDFTKYNDSRIINKIRFPADKNNGKYIALNGLYLEDMTLNKVIKKMGNDYVMVNGEGETNPFLKTEIQYEYSNCKVNYTFSANKLTELSIEMTSSDI